MNFSILAASIPPAALMGVVVGIILLFSLVLVFFSRFRRCPSDKIMVIYGKVGQNKDGTARSAKCIHGGAAFIVPVIQSYQYLDLTPISLSVDLTNALSRQNIRIDVPSRFTVGISTEPGIMQNAAERLLGLRLNEIQELAKDIIFGQMRLIIATMEIEEINTDRDKFLDAVSTCVEGELKKIGLRLINVNVTDISDESGYIEALGKEAAAKAINEARISVAERTREGSIGEANAVRDQRISVAAANATAVGGENQSKADIAKSDATRRELEADALRRAVTAEKLAEAKAKEESYSAQQLAEKARAEREHATQQADIIVKARIEKERMELAAEAEAEQTRRRARGEADAIFAKMEAQARGIEEVLSKQAEGFSNLVKAAGGSADSAVQLMLVDKIEELVKIQVEAVKNLNIDKVTVWDSAGGKDGTSSTANFLSGMMKSIPPLSDTFKMAGLQIPAFLGKQIESESAPVSAEPAETPAE
ncbi:MAG TPA: flotillin [Ruminococcaceae bacterium]|jgi:flotillin|nr:flotillin [Oscillospiraceae bacterium]